MELKLNIYSESNPTEIEKTYVAQDFHLMMGTCEDVLGLIDIDKFKGGLDDEETLMEIFKIVIKAFNEFKPLMKQVFVGLTEDEYRRADVKEVTLVVMDILKYSFTELFKASSKN